MPPTLLDNLNPYSFSWDSSGDEQNASLVSAHGIAPVGKVCEFYINAHVHLNCGREIPAFTNGKEYRSYFSEYSPLREGIFGGNAQTPPVCRVDVRPIFSTF
jgi:hypothetical protein